MNRSDLNEQVHQAIGISIKEADVVVNAILDSIVRALRSADKVKVRGFGSFGTRRRRGHIGRNPKTGTRVEVQSKRISFFKTGKELLELVNRPGVDG